MKTLLGILVGVYILGVFANGAIIQYVEDPFGCRQGDESFFVCPWSPERENDAGHDDFNERVLLWPIHMMDTLKRVSEEESPYPGRR